MRPLLTLILLAALLATGLALLIRDRLRAGDTLPPYSSLRTDPLGASVLYESLAALPAPEVSRNYRPTRKIPANPGLTLLALGLPTTRALPLDSEEAAATDHLLRSGARLILTLRPGSSLTISLLHLHPDDPKKPSVDFWKKTGLTISDKRPEKILKPEKNLLEDNPLPQIIVCTTDPQPESLPWRSNLYFTDLDPAWTILARTTQADGSHPVLIERPWGAGALVVATDTSFLSNQNLAETTPPVRLLSRILGPAPRQILFDEVLHGLVEQPGVGALLRQYRLHPLFAALLLLFALFIWQNSSPLVPTAPPDPSAQGLADPSDPSLVRSAQDSAAALLHLLRRSVPPAHLLPLCLEQWSQSRRRPLDPALDPLPAAIAHLAQKPAPPPTPATYRHLAHLLHQPTPPLKPRAPASILR